MTANLSKSRYLAGLQCEKLLWVQLNRPQLIPKPDDATQAMFDQGHAIGDLAKKLHPDGIEVPHVWNKSEAAERTRALLVHRRPLFEPAFVREDRFCKVDILVPSNDGRSWDLIEVKSSSKAKPEHIDDVAFQTFCAEGSGLTLDRLFVMHVDRGYIRRGDIEPHKLLHAEDVTTQARAATGRVRDESARLLELAGAPEPDIPIGPHCDSPYECALKFLCWNFLPEHSVADLYRAGARRFELMEDGILSLTDAPAERLTPNQRVQREAVLKRAPVFDKTALRAWLDKLVYPLWLLDFETFGPAIPLLDGTRPFQQIPFQISLHRLDSRDAEPTHYEYLAEQLQDATDGILAILNEITSEGSVVAYNASFEKKILEQLIEHTPASESQLRSIIDRVVDLLDPFRSFAYYHPDQHGSASLKAVLPAVTGESYESDRISDGQQAAREWLNAVTGQGDLFQKQEIFDGLRKYCGKDTRVMVNLIQELERLSG